MAQLGLKGGASVELFNNSRAGGAVTEPEGDWQRLWFWLRSKSWSALAMVPTDAEVDALGVARSFVAVGHANGAHGLTLLNATGLPAKELSSVLETIEGAGRRGGLVVVCEPVGASPATLPIVRAATGTLLLVGLGTSKLRSARNTVEAIGRDRVIASITISPGD